MVFDGSGAAPAPADIAIEDGRIADIGLGLDGDERLDVGGRAVLPGLFDCHTHLVFSDVDVLRALGRPFSLQFYEAAANLRATLAVGITTVRDMAGADLGVKEAVDTGLIPGPRVKISIQMLSQTGGHADGWMPCGLDVPTLTAAHPGRPSALVDGPDEMRKKVRELIRMGADFIKLCTSGGVLSPRDDPRHPHFAPDELDTAVREAASAGRYVAAHAHAADGIKNGLRAGIRSIEHGVFLDDEAIALLLERDAWLVPTMLAPRGVISAIKAGAALAETTKAKAFEVIDSHTDSIARAVAAGVRIAMGTDCPISAHGTNLEELALLVGEAGMSPTAALVAATSSAAQLLGVADELGTLEPGKRADLVVLDGDPLDVAGMAERVRQVWKDGRLVHRADVSERW